ncbi:MAG TPA: phospholipid carrier-dependent glycosyltransferase, partial [Planctomycetota bacterium]|nr:phospholipid carrier-dependent glycosyltransferase [Planctomycetota bacterium]
MRRALPVLLVVLAVVGPFVGLGRRDLWAPDEADHATAARELLVDGRWAVPTIAGETFAEKPPLQVWLIVLSAKLRGTDVDAFDARVPSAIGSALLVLATYVLGFQCRGRKKTAALAALVAATTSEVFLRARWCQVDGLFAGLFAWAAVGGVHLATPSRLYLDDRYFRLGNGTASVLTGIALGLAVLTKGPLAIALLGAALIGHVLVVPSHRRECLRAAIRYGPVVLGLAIAIAIPWYLTIASRDSQGLWRALVYENLGRLTDSQSHRQPPWYYLGTFWTTFAPASLLAIPAFAWVFRATRGSVGGAADHDTVRGCAGAFLGGFVLLSIASSKQGKYLLPLAPYLAVLVAEFAT